MLTRYLYLPTAREEWQLRLPLAEPTTGVGMPVVRSSQARSNVVLMACMTGSYLYLAEAVLSTRSVALSLFSARWTKFWMSEDRQITRQGSLSSLAGAESWARIFIPTRNS